jgi:hypothetical protein
MLKKVYGCFCITVALACSCGFYSFSGSTLPQHLKTVDIPLFANQSLMPGVAEELTDALSKQVVAMNLLSITSKQGDATISGTVVEYSNTPRTFGTSGTRQVDVAEYIVRISVAVEFMDNKSGNPLFKGTIKGEGIYDFKASTEAAGRATAEKDVVQQILQQSVQSW